MEDGKPIEDEFRVLRADGRMRWVFGRAQALRNEAGKPVKLLGTVQDVTDRRQLQSQLAAAERLATVGTLAGGVAHEINNPLSSVISNLEFVLEALRRSLPASPGLRPTELVAAMGEALEGADRVSRIVHDLMAFSRPREQGGPVDVERVLDLSVNMATNETRCRARVVKDYGAVPRTDADPAALGQVFLSLLVNAAQAIPPGKPEEHQIRLTTRAEGRWIEVSVADTGAGMSPDVQGRIFEPFFTTRPVGGGVGLGLSTSLAVVRGLGGDIAVQSEEGKGSVFTVTLPVGADVSPEVPAAHPGERRGKVLIIDDEPATAAVAGALSPDHDVRLARTGAAAMQEIAASGPFDAVLCSLGLKSPSGIEVHGALRKRDPELASRMVFLTGTAFTAEHQSFLASMPNRVIAKPLAVDALRSFLREELGREAASRG